MEEWKLKILIIKTVQISLLLLFVNKWYKNHQKYVFLLIWIFSFFFAKWIFSFLIVRIKIFGFGSNENQNFMSQFLIFFFKKDEQNILIKYNFFLKVKLLKLYFHQFMCLYQIISTCGRTFGPKNIWVRLVSLSTRTIVCNLNRKENNERGSMWAMDPSGPMTSIYVRKRKLIEKRGLSRLFLRAASKNERPEERTPNPNSKFSKFL